MSHFAYSGFYAAPSLLPSPALSAWPALVSTLWQSPPTQSVPTTTRITPSTMSSSPPPPKTAFPRPAPYPYLNMAEIHVPYVHYSDDPRDPDIQLPEDLLVFLYRIARKTATKCRKQYNLARDAASGKKGARSPTSPLPSPPATPTSPRSSVSSYSYSPFIPPSPPQEDAQFILFSSSPLNTLLVPRVAPQPVAPHPLVEELSYASPLPRYTIARALDHPSRGWITATIQQQGAIVGRMECKAGSNRGVLAHAGGECLLRKCVQQEDSGALTFYAPELHPARFRWRRHPSSADFQCLMQHPSVALPTLAATLSPPEQEDGHPYLTVRAEAMDCLELVLLTMLVVENCGR